MRQIKLNRLMIKKKKKVKFESIDKMLLIGLLFLLGLIANQKCRN